MRRLMTALAIVLTVFVGLSGPVLACGGLIAANGSVQLLRTSTLVAHVDGIEHYVTSFSFASAEESFGSIVPLPGEPTEVERAGSWTLQRLDQEVNGFAESGEFAAVAADGAAREVEVLREERIDSLDITILKGGGPEVAAWAEEQGFELNDDSPQMLEFYADRSPYFMAARFDADAAVEDGFTEGDGVPVHLEIPTDDPWVPLHILSLGKPGDEIVQADVFLLTEQRPELLGAEGLRVERSERAGDLLLDDLRSDENSEWVPEKAWFTHVRVDTPAAELETDLAVGVNHEPSLVAAGLRSAAPTIGGVLAAPSAQAAGGDSLNADWQWGVTGALLGLGTLLILGGGFAVLVRPGSVRNRD